MARCTGTTFIFPKGLLRNDRGGLQQRRRPSRQPQPSLAQKLLLLVIAAVVCLIVFLGLDAAYSHFSRKSSVPTPAEIFGCLGRDPAARAGAAAELLVHARVGARALSAQRQQQGFRDETVREVPLTDPRPRILMLGDRLPNRWGRGRTSFVGRLRSDFRSTKFLNGGVGGYSPSNYLNTERIAMSKRTGVRRGDRLHRHVGCAGRSRVGA